MIGSTISGNHSHRGGGGAIFNTDGGTVTILDSTISGNSPVSEYQGGGGIYNERASTVEVTDSTISGNSDSGGSIGGGVVNLGAFRLTNSTVSGNSAFSGGGIYSIGALTVTNSTFSGNRGHGAGIASHGTLEVTNSTFSQNIAVVDYCEIDCVLREVEGGGIFSDGTLNVTNSTFSGNRASAGGGVFNGKDYYGNAGTATLRNTILADSISGENCGGEGVTDGGYNVDDGASCGFAQYTGSLPDTDPLLDPEGLRDNGGPTPTIALLPDSPAVDLVRSGCPPPETDQRGVQRPQGEACDSGAFELGGP